MPWAPECRQKIFPFLQATEPQEHIYLKDYFWESSCILGKCNTTLRHPERPTKKKKLHKRVHQECNWDIYFSNIITSLVNMAQK